MMIPFVNCTFLGNIAHTEQYNVLFTDVMGNPQEGYGRGGGVHVSIKNSIDHVHMSFLGCHFIGNHAFIGGGLSIKMHRESEDDAQEMRNFTVAVINSTFAHNGCRHPNHTYFEGGIHLSFRTVLEHSERPSHHRVISPLGYMVVKSSLDINHIFSNDFVPRNTQH